MTLNEALRVIQTQTKTQEDLEAVRKAWKTAYDNVQRSNIAKFIVGDTVKFDSKRGPVTGNVTKINRKTIKIKDEKNNVLWSVSPQLIKLV